MNEISALLDAVEKKLQSDVGMMIIFRVKSGECKAFVSSKDMKGGFKSLTDAIKAAEYKNRGGAAPAATVERVAERYIIGEKLSLYPYIPRG